MKTLNLDTIKAPFCTTDSNGEFVKGYKTAKGAAPAMKKDPSLTLINVEDAKVEMAKKSADKSANVQENTGKINVNKMKFGKTQTIESLHEACERIWKGRFEIDFGAAIEQGYDEQLEVGYDGHYWWGVVTEMDVNGLEVHKCSKRVRLDYFLNYMRLPAEIRDEAKARLKADELKKAA